MRKNFSATFKSKIALEAAKEQESLRALAGKYELQPTQIQQWKEKLIEGLP